MLAINFRKHSHFQGDLAGFAEEAQGFGGFADAVAPCLALISAAVSQTPKHALPEAAAALGISTSEVCRRRNEGSLAGFRYGVNKYLYEPPLARPCNNLAEGVAV